MSSHYFEDSAFCEQRAKLVYSSSFALLFYRFTQASPLLRLSFGPEKQSLTRVSNRPPKFDELRADVFPPPGLECPERERKQSCGIFFGKEAIAVVSFGGHASFSSEQRLFAREGYRCSLQSQSTKA
jgi:hypothetical protein